MDTIFIENGIEMLHWTDENGNKWKAALDAVEFFGKECFEQMPDPREIFLGSWEVAFNNPDANGLLLSTLEDEEYAESFNL